MDAGDAAPDLGCAPPDAADSSRTATNDRAGKGRAGLDRGRTGPPKADDFGGDLLKMGEFAPPRLCDAVRMRLTAA